MRSLADQRVLVVGASSGLGRAIATTLAANGARVVMTARRLDRLEGAVAETSGKAIALAHDVRDPASTASVVDAALQHLGGLDALVFCPGVGLLRKLVEVDADVWRDTLETNVIGAAMVTNAVVPHLAASGGRAIYLSSDAASSTPPWPGIGAYTVSKAALDKLIDAFRAEHPEVAFTRLVVGPTAGQGPNTTEFANEWDAELAGEMVPMWMARGYMNGNLVDQDALTDVVAAMLSSTADLPTVVIRPR